MLGGDLTATSREGEGSEFTVRLPAEVEEEAEKESAESAVPALRSPNTTSVLVIDDDAAARDLMSRFLTREGFQVEVARSGPEGLRLARANPPDAITLDVMMPGMDGWAVLSELKADPALSEIPVVVVTITDDQSLGYALGASEYMTKPIDRERLASILHRYDATARSQTVLVVEDDLLSRTLLRESLERHGGRVVEAENGQQGLERIREEIPALILLDLMMPVMDGFEFLEQLRAQPAWREIPVVVVTAKDLTAEDRQALGLGAERILEKGALGRDALLARMLELVHNRLPAVRVESNG
jgi:CheY-like chemotaxis protein